MIVTSSTHTDLYYYPTGRNLFSKPSGICDRVDLIAKSPVHIANVAVVPSTRNGTLRLPWHERHFEGSLCCMLAAVAEAGDGWLGVGDEGWF